ncbi:unnamed protein product [Fusarium equiseti]|uniref:Uncharacterized protein n=1 Tax=Fusarium equiseti TaxID=61235 RepID=A0A8J2J175_FUSEQ|nr:unnamed protein product [Fusarium equiseti]
MDIHIIVGSVWQCLAAMSFDSPELRDAVREALAEARATGDEGHGGARKGSKPCCHCGSEQHRSQNCPRKGEPPLRTEVPAQQDASPPRETPPASAAPAAPPSAPTRRVTVELVTWPVAPPEQVAVDFLIWQPRTVEEEQEPRIDFFPEGRIILPPPAPEPQFDRPPERQGWTIGFCEFWNRFWYQSLVDGRYEWYVEHR